MNAERFNDYSGNFSALRRELWESPDCSYRDFLKSLKPDYARVRRDVAFGYLMIALTLLVCAVLPRLGVPAIVMALLSAVSIGYWIAYLQLFIHEGAHYNLAPDREGSDRFCDRYVAWMVGTTVAAYRKVHFQHHRALGTPEDSEHTYFFPLNLMFFIKGLLGIRAMEVIFARKAIVDGTGATKAKDAPEKAAGPGFNAALLLAPLAHGGIVMAAYLAGLWWVALAWLVGVGMIFPFLGALRQLLEHRDEDAMADTDYFRVPHGAMTRMFRDGAFSSTFGGAGFNRHLLHHWEPQISYTNLPEYEAFLENTHARPILEQRRTTYGSTFLKLLSI
ncbi:MAG: fatty acid desaturase [Mesorhizobium sp.]|nr:fatty acid desaturase [Mesorhizobium sp.]